MWLGHGGAVPADAGTARLLPGLLPADQNQGISNTALDERGIDRALQLAAQADYRTSPNPMVGAVVADRHGNFVGEGFHRRAGEPHAEVLALQQAGDRARGGTLYVNLEPCAHRGRTPPCSEAIIAAGIRRVSASMLDPDQRVRGRGVEALRAAGVDVDVGAEEERALRLNEFFVKHRTTGLPFVTAKFAMSLDGKIATRTGRSRWISGAAAREHAHLLRHQHDAVLVGVGTVLADDPELTSRLQNARQPLRVVLDSNLRTPASARVLPALVATTAGGELPGAELLRLPSDSAGRVDARALLEELGRRDVLSVLVEGGAEIHAALLAAGLVDKVVAYIAPIVIGGRAAAGPVAGLGVDEVEDALRLRDVEITAIGDDVLLSGYVHRDSQRDRTGRGGG